MGSPSPSSPVTQTTQISQMDPRLYQWLYGTANSPGRQQIANAAMLGKTMQGVQNADPTALAAFYNVPKGTDLAQFQSHTGAMNPGQADRALMQLPGQSITPQDYYKQATAGEKEEKKSPTSTAIAAEGGELDAYAQGGRPKPKAEQLAQPTADLNEYGLTASQQRQFDKYENMRNSGKKFTQQQIRDYNSMRDVRTQYAQANPNVAKGKTPLSLADAQIGVTPFYDPETKQSTNPYYNQAINVLKGMETMPGQYQQASDIYNRAAEGLLGQTNYQPERMSAASINRGDIRDVAAQLAQVERYKAAEIERTQREAAAQTQGPKSWTDPGTAQQYINPYAETSLRSQQRLANQQFAQQQNQLRSQATGQKAFGGSRAAIAEQAAQLNQNIANQNLAAQGMNTAYQSGMGQFQAEQGLGSQVGLANTQAINSLKSQYMQMGLTEAQANQAAINAASQFNTGSQNQAYNNYVAQQLQAQMSNQQMDWNTANQNAQLQQQAAVQNQQAGLTGQGLNLQAYNQAGNMGQGLLGVGQGIGAYNQNLLQNWGAAGNTLQNLAQGYYDKRQQSAQNIWGGVNTATQPATGTLLGSPWGTSYQGQYQQRKKGGKLSIKV